MQIYYFLQSVTTTRRRRRTTTTTTTFKLIERDARVEKDGQKLPIIKCLLWGGGDTIELAANKL